MSWQEIYLGNAIHMKHSFAFKSQWFAPSGKHIVLTPGNFKEAGGFKERPGKDRYYSTDAPEEFILKKGDVIVAMTEQTPGLLGSSALIPEDNLYLHNQRLGLVDKIDGKIITKNYLYTLFNTRDVRAQISGSASGVKVRHTSPERIYRVKVKIPNVTIQEKISSTIFAYDDLSENNRRRIQLLEESARQLYKEWFVRLRFPGHEHVKVVDGVPEGWEEMPLGDVLLLQRGFDLPAQQRSDGNFPVCASTGVCGKHNEYRAIGPGVVTGRSGSLGTVLMVAENFWPLNTTLWIKEYKKTTPFHARYLLESLALSRFNGGAAVPTLNRNDVHAQKILLPPESLIKNFTDIAQTAFNQHTVLEKQNHKLAQARDLLLPKLMSGEVAV